MENASLYWLLIINNGSDGRIFWRLRLAEFDFEVKHKNGKANTGFNVLSRLHTVSEMIPHDNSDGIPKSFVDEPNLELQLNIQPDEAGFDDVEYNQDDEVYVPLDEQTPPIANF